MAVSTANGDDAGNTGRRVLGEIAALPSPPAEFHAWIVTTNGGATQNLGYWTMDEPIGRAKLIKSSANTDITNNNSCYALSGAEYGVYSDLSTTNQIGTLITNKWGHTNEIDLRAGTYYVKELVTPNGYALDPNTYPITVQSNQTAELNVQDVPLADPIGILLRKIDAETNLNRPQGNASLANAEFTIKYFDSFYDINPEEQGITPVRQWVLKTDDDGYTDLSAEYKVAGDDFYYAPSGDIAIPFGTVTIEETKAPEGYSVNTEVFVRQIKSDSATEMVSTYNAPTVLETVQKGSVELYKSDGESGNKLANAVYGIYFNNAEIARLTTNENGHAKSNLLPYGNYYLQEITAPEGYILDTTKHPFTIGNDGEVIKITATNQNQMGQIQGYKTGEVLTRSDFRMTELGMMYAPIYEVQGLPDASYEIFAKTDILTPQGTLKYAAGELVDTVVTDTQGEFLSTELYLGTYVLKENQAPNGYILDTNEYEVTLSYGGQNESIVLSPISLTNERQKVSVILKKVMESNIAYPNKNAYQDVRFGLFTADNIIGINGDITFEKDSLLEVLSIDENGVGKVTTDLPIGSYYVQEIATNKSYILDDTKYPVDFEYQGQDVVMVEIIANNNEAITNNLKKGTVNFIKKSTNGIVLKNCGIEILNNNMQVIAQGETDDNGNLSFTLPLGEYYYREYQAPNGYVLDNTLGSFSITEHEETIEIEVINDKIAVIATGDNQWIVPLLVSSCVLALGALVVTVIYVKKNKQA